MHSHSALTAHLEKLPYFLEVAARGSFRKASETLRIAQPSLSKAIAVLETACGVRLFERHRRGTTLTPEGERLVTTARLILRAAAAYETGAAAPAGPPLLRFVTHELLLPALAPGLAAATGKTLGLEIKTNPSVGQLLALIEDHQADAGVVGATTARRGLAFRSLVTDPYALACSPAFARAALPRVRRPLDLEDLRRLPVILAPGVLAGTNETLGARLLRHGLDLAPKHVVGSLESVAVLAAHGFGVGILPRALCGRGAASPLVELAYRSANSIPFGVLELLFACRQESWQTDAGVQKLFAAATRSLRKLHLPLAR